MRATTEPSAASRSAALTPSDSSRAGRPSSPSAHSAACSTPTERGRASARLSTATASTPPAASSAGAAPPGEQLRGDALRLGLHGLGDVAEQVALAVEDGLDALARQRPEVAFDVEVAAEG